MKKAEKMEMKEFILWALFWGFVSDVIISILVL